MLFFLFPGGEAKKASAPCPNLWTLMLGYIDIWVYLFRTLTLGYWSFAKNEQESDRILINFQLTIYHICRVVLNQLNRNVLNCVVSQNKSCSGIIFIVGETSKINVFCTVHTVPSDTCISMLVWYSWFICTVLLYRVEH